MRREKIEGFDSPSEAYAYGREHGFTCLETYFDDYDGMYVLDCLMPEPDSVVKSVATQTFRRRPIRHSLKVPTTAPDEKVWVVGRREGPGYVFCLGTQRYTKDKNVASKFTKEQAKQKAYFMTLYGQYTWKAMHVKYV